MAVNVQKVIILTPQELLEFCGQADRRLRQLQTELDARIIARGNELRISGTPEDVDKAHGLISELLHIHRKGNTPLSDQQMAKAASNFEQTGPKILRDVYLDTIPVPLKRKHVAPLTPMQKTYVDSIRRHSIVFGVGPAGTGKTYLAVAMAVMKLMAGDVGRIILVRPAVEAGERLGFLPGDIAAKFDPFVRPLYDALYEMLDTEQMQEFIAKGIIEIAPLAFMRGRTLNNSFIILDEAQNTSVEQMKMFLTRMGMDSQVVVTGDPSQMDLPDGKKSGLVHARKVLENISGIDFIEFSGNDVVRHSLVQRIIEAYDHHTKTK